MNQTNFKSLLRHMVYAAVCLALCMVLPFLTGQIPQIGSALSPMHIPVLLAGFLCGPWWAMAVGFAAPMLRHVWMGMPPLITAIAMSFELAGYGLFSGLLYRLLPKKTVNIYVSLIGAMILGRIIWGIAMVVISGVTGSAFTWSAFMAGALLNAIPTTDEDAAKKPEVLEGDIPSPVNPPKGCKFHTRCKYCTEICTHVVPEMREIRPNHFVACHHILEKGSSEG